MLSFAGKRGVRFRWARRLLAALAFLAVAYGGLQFFPQAAFAYHVKAQNFTVYSNTPIDPNVAEVVRQADDLLRRSPIYDDSPQRVFLTGSDLQYSFFAPHAPGSMGVAMQGSRTIFLRHTDVAHNRLGSRALGTVLAHERTHVLVEKRLGLVRANAAPKWKKEGYPTYVAAEPVLLSAANRAQIKSSGLQSIQAMHHGYVVYHLRVKYLMDVEKMSFDDLFARDFDLAQLDRRVAENIDTLVAN